MGKSSQGNSGNKGNLRLYSQILKQTIKKSKIMWSWSKAKYWEDSKLRNKKLQCTPVCVVMHACVYCMCVYTL
jgi:hypothetical protein